ncbi:hypothetical protein TRAPUB_11459 [Trametes pubescens]|uniref:Uncharacterized protein n=1 Tax=Trametes pubescens TaxID=154538 RepID=A0A1M2VWR4_TRAPU|nr:hypothetical protein TRAPUB_11459 [Trametes pubescens]
MHSESQFRARWSAKRSLANAEFVLHADTKWEADLISRRLLRLALERSPESAEWNMCKDICIIVDLSDAYPHRMRQNPDTSDDESSVGDGDSSPVPSEDTGGAVWSPQALYGFTTALAVIPHAGRTHDTIASFTTPSEIEIAGNSMVEPAVNSPRAPGLPSVLQQADDTSLPPMPNGSSPTAAHCACSTTPGASSDGDRGDSGVSPMRSCTTIMATTSECDPRVPAIPAVSSSAAGEDITQAAESGEAQTPYASGPHSVDATTLQRENTDLRAALASQNVILSSQIAERSSQMAAVLARLDTTAGPSQLDDRPTLRRKSFPRNPKKKRTRCIVM